MTIEHLASISIGAAIPSFLATQVALDVSLSAQLPIISAQLAGQLNVLAAITIQPPQLLATIEAAIDVVASLQAALDGPTVTLQASAVASVVASLELQLAAIQVAIDFSLSIGSLLTQANIDLYTYTGPVSEMASELSAILAAEPPGDPTDESIGLLLTGSTTAAIAALAELFA